MAKYLSNNEKVWAMTRKDVDLLHTVYRSLGGKGPCQQLVIPTADLKGQIYS